MTEYEAETGTGHGVIWLGEHLEVLRQRDELLEALKGSRELFSELLRDEVLDEPTPEDVALFDAIDAAIAKAESSNRLESEA